MLEPLRYCAASVRVQKRQSVVAPGFWRLPGEVVRYEAMYCWQVWPAGGWKTDVSTAEHWIGLPATVVEAKPATQYVKGDTLFVDVSRYS